MAERSNNNERTSCACELCKCACHCMPGYLTPSDLPFFDVSKLAASEGAVVMKDGERIELPTLVPQQHVDGRCVFLDDNGGCSVWEHSPYGCRMFSVCDESDDSLKRYHGLMELWNSHSKNDEYSRLTRTLPKARPRRLRMGDFKQEFDRIVKERDGR